MKKRNACRRDPRPRTRVHTGQAHCFSGRRLLQEKADLGGHSGHEKLGFPGRRRQGLDFGLSGGGYPPEVRRRVCLQPRTSSVLPADGDRLPPARRDRCGGRRTKTSQSSIRPRRRPWNPPARLAAVCAGSAGRGSSHRREKHCSGGVGTAGPTTAAEAGGPSGSLPFGLGKGAHPDEQLLKSRPEAVNIDHQTDSVEVVARLLRANA
jgi:hypothetical protein